MQSPLTYLALEYNLSDTLWDQAFKIMMASSAWIEKSTAVHLKRIILLTGVSCTGKSSIADALEKIDSTVVHIDLDEILRDIILQFLLNKEKTLTSQLYQKFGNDLSTYIFYSQIDQTLFPLPPDFSDNAKKLNELVKKEWSLLEKNLHYVIHDKVKNHIFLGKQVVISLVATGTALNPFQEFSPITVTLYTPLPELIANLHGRNSRAILQKKISDYRQPEVVFSQSPLFFSRHPANSIEPALYFMSSLEAQAIQDNYLLSAKNLKFLTENYMFPELIHKQLLPNTGKPLCLYFHERTELLLNTHNLKTKDLAIIINLFLKNKAQFDRVKKLSYSNLSHSNIDPALIIFDGMSSSGKTTIARTFLRLSTLSILLYRSEQQKQLALGKMPAYLKRKNTAGMSVFAYARYRENSAFSETFEEINKISKHYLKEIDEFMRSKQAEIFCLEEKYAARKAKKYLDLGINVLLDNLIKKDDLSEFSDLKLKPLVVLVYCPFENLLQHIIARHSQAVNQSDPAKWRDPFLLYKSYPKFFGPVNIHGITEPLEILRRDKVKHVLEQLCQKFQPEKFRIKPDNFLDEMLVELGLGGKDQVEIYPQLRKPDIVLNTQNFPAVNVRILIDFIEKRNKSISTFQKGYAF